jgi:hypothetical protein
MSERRSTEKNRLMLSPYRVPLNTEKPQIPDLNVSYCNNCNNRLTRTILIPRKLASFLLVRELSTEPGVAGSNPVERAGLTTICLSDCT